MLFSEYALGLSPYISFGKSEADYFKELIGSFIKDAAMDSCQLLKRKPDTKYRYIVGTRQIQPKDAQYIYDHRDTTKYSNWIWDRMGDTDSYDSIVAWLDSYGITGDNAADDCAVLLESIILDIAKKTPIKHPTQRSDKDLKLIDEIQKKIQSLPRPENVPVPKVASQDEQTYIEELYMAYGDAEKIDDFCMDDLSTFPIYSDDLDDRRIDFYAAETIRRGVLELGGGGLAGQFDVLKDETLNGVKDTARRSHPNGYERMLSVMEQAIVAPVTNYILSSSPYWISGKIKKGVCHHLVNDGKLTWIKKDNRS